VRPKEKPVGGDPVVAASKFQVMADCASGTFTGAADTDATPAGGRSSSSSSLELLWFLHASNAIGSSTAASNTVALTLLRDISEMIAIAT
jgi:hypothetical protein